MEVIAFTTALDPILTRGQQLVGQYRTWKENKKNASELCSNFTSFEAELALCITRLQTEAAKLPQLSRAIIDDDITTLSTYLTAARAALQNLNRRLSRNRMLQFFRANAVAKDCDTLATKLDKARELLNNAVKHADQRATLEILREGQSQAVVDRFRKCFPPMSSGMQAVLDFHSKDEDGNPMTPEGRVKHLVEQARRSPRVVSIHGMGGVGKSTIMRALSVDEQLRQRFPDGVHTIKLGEDASTATLFRQICQVLDNSGAEKTSQSLRMRNDVDEALTFFERWFDSKKCALLVDDVWVHGVGLNSVSRLCKIGSGLSGTCVLITTREHEVASLAPRDRIVRLEPRDARGDDARRILLFHADLQLADLEYADRCAISVNESITGILDICGGLPVCLSAAGKNVKLLSMNMSAKNEEDVWKHYLCEVVKSRERLLKQNVGSYGNLFATLAASISILEQKPLEEILGFTPALSFGQMYRRLFVLQKQAAVPSAMLKHLWQVESEEYANIVARTFTEAGLANREVVRAGEETMWYLSLHDSLHDFAVEEAKRHGDTEEAHNSLLKGYSSCDPEICREVRGTSRWWSPRLEADGYIHRNVCRHLLETGRGRELVALLLSPQWAKRQLEVNGFLFLESDFSLGIRAVQEGMIGAASAERCELDRALRLILDALTLSSAFTSRNIAELWFQLQGRLRSFTESCRSIREHVDLIETEGERPLALCSSSFLAEAGGANTRIISIGVSVTCMAFLKDEERVACGCSDGRIFIVNVARAAVEKQWNAHDKQVRAIAVNEDGTLLVSGSWDGTAKVFDVATGRCTVVFKGHTDRVTCVAWIKTGNVVVSGSLDGTAHIWNMETGQAVSSPFTGHEGGVRCVAVLGDGEEVVTGGEDKKLRVWNATTGAQIGGAFEGHEGRVACVALTPDGKRIVSGSWDHTIRMWDVGSHQQIGASLEGHRNVECVSVSGDGSRIVSSSTDKVIEVWDLRSRKRICDPLEGHTDHVMRVSFLAGGDRILSCSRDETVRVWDVRRIRTERVINRLRESVSSVSFSPDGEFVLSTEDEVLRIWNTTSGQQVGDPLEGHSQLVTDVLVTPNGRWVVSVSLDKTVRVWELESRKLLYTLSGHTDFIQCVAILPQGDRAVTGSDDNSLRIWDLTSMDGSHVVLEGHSAEVWRVFLTDDGMRIVSVDLEHNVFVWELETKKVVKRGKKKEAWTLSRREIFNLVGETTVSGDSKLSIPLYGREIVYGDGLDATVLATMETRISSWALSPDMKTVCVGLYDGTVGFMKLVR